MKAVLKETRPKAKPGRKASGLRELSPEAARLAISTATLELVQAGVGGWSGLAKADGALRVAARKVGEAERFAGRIGERLGYAMAPTLERLLQGDVRFGVVPVADEGGVRMKAVVRGDGGVSRLRQAGVPLELVRTAEAFLEDVERARIGKLTASYGEGGGGATAAEPERVVAAIQRLVAAQEALNTQDRVVLWGALVFGLSMEDIGHATDGGRMASRQRMIERAGLRLEIALERIRPHYQRDGRG